VAPKITRVTGRHFSGEKVLIQPPFHHQSIGKTVHGFHGKERITRNNLFVPNFQTESAKSVIPRHPLTNKEIIRDGQLPPP
jgi:hypothetical protein